MVGRDETASEVVHFLAAQCSDPGVRAAIHEGVSINERIGEFKDDEKQENKYFDGLRHFHLFSLQSQSKEPRMARLILTHLEA